MVTFLAVLLMAYTFHNLLGLLESAIMLRTLMHEINVYFLVFNPIMVDNYAAFFNCTPVGRASDSMMAPT